jgi:hypothetical protein
MILVLTLLLTLSCFEQREVTRGGVVKDVIFVVIGLAIIVGIFYFALYHFLLRAQFHYSVAHSISVALTALYSLCMVTLIVLPYHLLDYWQWFGLFMVLGVGWLFLTIFLLATANR